MTGKTWTADDTVAARVNRIDTINRAINLIDTASAADLTGWLAQVNVRDHLKANPAALRDMLASAKGADFLFPAWKIAQQILQAAGLPH